MERYKLEEFNHWWIKGKVDTDLALSFKRDIYQAVEKSLDKRFITALVGLRRVGKTTIMYQIIEKLIESKIGAENILFFSFDESNARIADAITTYVEIHNKDLRRERVYVFFDEIQKCAGWENEIKKYYDLYPKLKFVISGSESLFIKKKTKETLAGRVFEFFLPTFTFAEYLKFYGITGTSKYETGVKPLFIKFIQKGGFPETFTLKGDKEFKEYVKSLVVDKITYKDIPKIFKAEDPEFLKMLLELIATNPGMYIDYQSLGKQFGKDRRLVKAYLFYLKESFLINMLGNYRKSSMSSLRKSKRAYPSDTALIYLHKPNADSALMGKIIETAAVNKVKATAFWKNSYEIDIINNGIPIEVKYQEKISQEDLKPLIEFMEKFNQKKGIIITKNDEQEVVLGTRKIRLIPAWKWFMSD